MLGAVVVYFFLYESASLSLENINKMYGTPGLKPWQSEKWTPPVSNFRLLASVSSLFDWMKGLLFPSRRDVRQ